MHKSDISQMTLGAVLTLMRTAETILRRRDIVDANAEALEIYNRLHDFLEPFKDQLQSEDKSAYMFVVALTCVLFDYVQGFMELLEAEVALFTLDENETRH